MHLSSIWNCSSVRQTSGIDRVPEIGPKKHGYQKSHHGSPYDVAPHNKQPHHFSKAIVLEGKRLEHMAMVSGMMQIEVGGMERC